LNLFSSFDEMDLYAELSESQKTILKQVAIRIQIISLFKIYCERSGHL
jgi:hypothetical protein